ncbi:MAG: hypothetical protein JNJ63_13440 [Hyphomonadaceae bacterium]|nr:hypothetical protein [Hyphomonadaceae bacterium]
MSLFFDAAWFDAKLAERGLDRGDLASAAQIERAALHSIYSDERAATAAELAAFAMLLQADLVEVTLRAGVAARPAEAEGDADARIESIEARLNAIDDWIAEFERSAKRA